MKCVDFNYSGIYGELRNIVSQDSFCRIKDSKIAYSPYEIAYNKKLDSAFQIINTIPKSNSNLRRDSKEIESLLYQSSYWKQISDNQNRAQKKLFKILSIFESKDYIFVVYTISEVNSMLHTYPYYELIIK